MPKARAMKVTTIRFSDDLWAAVSAEAELAGLSASQFIREAALARAAAAAGARGEVPFDAAPVRQVSAGVPQEDQTDVEAALALLARATSGSLHSDSEALPAQSKQDRRA